jgi:hypothetical protein
MEAFYAATGGPPRLLAADGTQQQLLDIHGYILEASRLPEITDALVEARTPVSVLRSLVWMTFRSAPVRFEWAHRRHNRPNPQEGAAATTLNSRDSGVPPTAGAPPVLESRIRTTLQRYDEQDFTWEDWTAVIEAGNWVRLLPSLLFFSPQLRGGLLTVAILSLLDRPRPCPYGRLPGWFHACCLIAFLEWAASFLRLVIHDVEAPEGWGPPAAATTPTANTPTATGNLGAGEDAAPGSPTRAAFTDAFGAARGFLDGLTAGRASSRSTGDGASVAPARRPPAYRGIRGWVRSTFFAVDTALVGSGASPLLTAAGLERRARLERSRVRRNRRALWRVASSELGYLLLQLLFPAFVSITSVSVLSYVTVLFGI